MPIHVSPCVPSDGPALATLLTSTISGALRIELGKATPAALHQYLARYYPSFLERAAAANPVKEVCLKVVDDVEGMIAWAVWELPKEAGEEDQAVDDRTTPIYGMNVGFSIDLTRAGIKMRKSVLGGRKAFVLNSFSVFPAHKGGAAGTSLLSWPFERADKEGEMCYLDGEEGGACVTFAAELGFVKVDQFEIDLTLGGLEGVYTHVAMVREPNTTKVEVKVEEGKGGE